MPLLRTHRRAVAALLAGLLLAGCGGGDDQPADVAETGFAALSDDELQDRSNVCRGIVPGRGDQIVDAMVCLNIANECTLRRREGRYPC